MPVKIACTITQRLAAISAIAAILMAAAGLFALVGWREDINFLNQIAHWVAENPVVVIVFIVVAMLIFAALMLSNLLALRRAEKEQEHFFNVSLDLLCVAGFDGYFKKLNPAWEKALGFKLWELLEQPYIDFIHPDDHQATMAEARKISAGAKVLSFENRYQCKDGSYRWLQWNAAPVPESKLIYAAARDVTERKQIDEHIERLNHDLQRRADDLRERPEYQHVTRICPECQKKWEEGASNLAA